MLTADDAEPHLSLIRAVGRTLRVADRASGEAVEHARYRLWAALDAGDEADARAWALALRAALDAGGAVVTRAGAPRPLREGLEAARQALAEIVDGEDR